VEFAKRFSMLTTKMNCVIKFRSKLHYLLLVFGVCACVSCNQYSQDHSGPPGSINTQESKFDEAKWKTKKNLDFPFRDKMLKDLMTDPQFRQFKKDELTKLLGDADRIDANYHFYTIDQKRIGLWPLHTKTLVIKFFENDSIQWMKIHE